jgi:peptidoglycan/xylan/chitin deacetylase (PgdA/CDA1 family)
MTVCSRWVQALGVAALALAVATPVAAGPGWITPAAGPTATGDPEIVLTFDDGPNPHTTPRVLDTLAKHKVRAIFFLVGDRLTPDNKPAHDLVARMLREGHIVANHTVSHIQMCAVKEERAAVEIDAAAATIGSIAGMPTPWFRTPYGAYCQRLEAMLAERKITHFYWDIDSQEWKHNSAKRATAYITRALGRLQGRAVVLMHDTKVATVKALPQILAWLEAENKKRAESTRRQIRIVDPSTVARELVAPGLIEWLVQAGNAGLDQLTAAAACLP